VKQSDLPRQAQLARASFDHEVKRFESQRQFAASLCDLHPAKAKEWGALLDKAQALVEQAAGTGDTSALRQAVRQAEALLAPLAKVARTYTIHCAGHAHIDMNWMWSWPETVSLTVDTFSTVLKLMDEYPEFTFSQSQASVYAILEQHRPDLLARIAARVKEGRWEVTASHWVEGDKNLAGAEALCRHLLYTRTYMKTLFGLEPEDVPIDWSPDTFGHAASVPTYLAQGGVKYLYMHRPGDAEAAKLWLFRWFGRDGSSVLVRNDTPSSCGYNGEIRGDLLAKESAAFFKQTGLKDHLFVFGVGDHGGGPTRRDILMALELRDWPVFPRLVFGTASGYMKTIDPQATGVPEIKRELNCEFAGCYTTQTLIKKANRLGENRLVDAEMAASIGWGALGMPYPAKQFEEGWRDTLFSHFHDILPGSGVHDTRTYTHGLFQKTMAATAQIETFALRELANRVDTSSAGPFAGPDIAPSALCDGLGGGVGFQSVNGGLVASEQSGGRGARPFVVFNPLLHDRDEIIEVTLWDNAPVAATSPLKQKTYVAVGPDGKTAVAQIVNSGNFWRHDYVTVAFRAEVPAGGYSRYVVREEADPAARPGLSKQEQAVPIEPVHHCSYAAHERARSGLENEYLCVALDPVTGGILRLTDKRTGVDLVTPEQHAPSLEYTVERPHGMSAWQIQHPGEPPRAPVLRELKKKLTGPLKASVEATLRIEESDLTLTYELRAGDPRLYVKIMAVWFQRGSREIGVPALTFALPLALTGAAARYEIAFGAVDRTQNAGEEVPALQWAQVHGAARKAVKAGVLLINDSKHGHSLTGSTLRLTLIRSSYEPDNLPEIGQHEINLAIEPFGIGLPVADAIRTGQDFNRPLKTVGTGIHKGAWSASASWLRQEEPSILVSGVKRSENGDGLAVRLFNPGNRAAVSRLALPAALAKRVTGVETLDMMERPVAGAATWKGRSALLPMRGHTIATLLIRLKPLAME
jgi:alpha-mannosidase